MVHSIIKKKKMFLSQNMSFIIIYEIKLKRTYLCLNIKML